MIAVVLKNRNLQRRRIKATQRPIVCAQRCPALSERGRVIGNIHDPFILDLRDVGRNKRGVARVLIEVGSRLLAWYPEQYHAICGPSSPPLIRNIRNGQFTTIGQHSSAAFEQITLPFVATRLGAKAIYSHRECGALWGPPLLLHVPEDPEIRWARKSARATVDIVASGQGLAREQWRRIYSRALMNRSLRRATVVTSTRSTAADLQQRHQITADQVTIVPLGVDLDCFRPVDQGLGHAPYLFHLASNDPREHSEVVIEAFARFASHTPSSPRLIVAGDPGPKVLALRRLAADLGLSKRIEFLGWVSDEHLVRLYAGATATVLASADEGFGLQPLEAMACGSLFVAKPTPAIQEVADGAEVEWTSLEPAAMADAFAAIWTDRARRSRASVINRQVASRYSWDRTAERLHDLLCEIAKQNRGR